MVDEVDAEAVLPAALGTPARIGDLFKVARRATLDPDQHDGPRPMVCVAELPGEYVWRAMPRTTTVGDPAVDLFSTADRALGLDRDGWWTYRFLRSVRKAMTPDPAWCVFVTALQEPLRKQVLDHYRNRPKPSAGPRS